MRVARCMRVHCKCPSEFECALPQVSTSLSLVSTQCSACIQPSAAVHLVCRCASTVHLLCRCASTVPLCICCAAVGLPCRVRLCCRCRLIPLAIVSIPVTVCQYIWNDNMYGMIFYTFFVTAWSAFFLKHWCSLYSTARHLIIHLHCGLIVA